MFLFLFWCWRESALFSSTRFPSSKKFGKHNSYHFITHHYKTDRSVEVNSAYSTVVRQMGILQMGSDWYKNIIQYFHPYTKGNLIMTSSNGNISMLLALCTGNSPVSVNSPSQRPVKRSFDVFSDLGLNKRLSKQSWDWWFEKLSRPLWRHCNQYIFRWVILGRVCCDLVPVDFIIKFTSLTSRQSYVHPFTTETNLKNMGKYIKWMQNRAE